MVVHLPTPCELLLNSPGQFVCQPVPGPHGQYPGRKRPHQSEVAYHVQDLVPHHLVRIPQGILHALGAHQNHPVGPGTQPQTPALERLNLVPEGHRPGPCQLPDKGFGIQGELCVLILEAGALADEREGHAELLRRHGHHQPALVPHPDGPRKPPHPAQGRLFGQTHVQDGLHKGPGAAVVPGDLIPLHLDQGIVHLKTGERRQKVLHREHRRPARTQGGTPLRTDQGRCPDGDVHRRTPVRSPQQQAVIGGRREDPDARPPAGVQPDS